MANYTSYDITGIFDVLDFASNNQTLSSYDITGIFDDLDFASNNQTLSSYDITGIFDSLDFASNNQTLSSYDITGVFDSLDFATESPQKTIILPSFAVNPIVDPATILINEGDSEPAFSVAFTASVSTGSAPLTVNFTNNSVGPITEVHWDFGDGGTSTAYSPSHTYTNSGNYTVYLRVFAGPYYSQSSTVIQVVSVTADFSADLTTVNAGSLVTFTDTSTGTPTSWNWDFGDGSTHATTQNPTHIYTVAGTYTVTLIATNGYGSDTETKVNYITVNMVADFTAAPISGSVPLAVSFTDLSMGTPTSWFWDFGNGNTSTDQNPVNGYSNAGTYTVSLTATQGAFSDTETKVNYIVANWKICVVQRTNRHVIKELNVGSLPATYTGKEFGLYGESGSNNSTMKFPNGIVETIDGIFVCDTVNKRILKLDSNLSYVAERSTADTIGQPYQVALNSYLYFVGVKDNMTKIEKINSWDFSSLDVSGDLHAIGQLVDKPTSICRGFSGNSLFVTGSMLGLCETLESTGFSQFVVRPIEGEELKKYYGVVYHYVNEDIYINDGERILRVNSNYENVSDSNKIAKTIRGLKVDHNGDLLIYNADKQKIMTYDQNLNFVSDVYIDTGTGIADDAYDIVDFLG